MGTDLDKIAKRVASGGQLRTAGKIEFVKDSGPIRRDIRVQGFRWSSDALRNLAKILWSVQRSHSYGMAALRLFSKMPSSEFSPDGLLGGRGYIQSVKDMRSGLGQAVEVLSTFTDTVHDEINAEHWAVADEPEVLEIVEDAERVKANPEGFVEQEFDEGQGGMEGDFQNPSAEDFNPAVNPGSSEESEDEDEDDPLTHDWSAPRTSSSTEKVSEAALPTDESDQKEAKTAPEMVMHTTAPERGNYAAAIRRIVSSYETRTASSRRADSSLPVDTLPGPRVDHIGPAAGSEAGHFNYDEVWPSDDQMGEGFSQLDRIYEDYCADGVTGYDNPTDGDETILKISHSVAGRYSWLPGSENEKPMNYYGLDVTDEELEWIKANNQPDPPPDPSDKKKPRKDPLWEASKS